MDITKEMPLKLTYQVLGSALLITTCGRSEHGSLVLAQSGFSPLALLASYSSLEELLHITSLMLVTPRKSVNI